MKLESSYTISILDNGIGNIVIDTFTSLYDTMDHSEKYCYKYTVTDDFSIEVDFLATDMNDFIKHILPFITAMSRNNDLDKDAAVQFVGAIRRNEKATTVFEMMWFTDDSTIIHFVNGNGEDEDEMFDRLVDEPFISLHEYIMDADSDDLNEAVVNNLDSE